MPPGLYAASPEKKTQKRSPKEKLIHGLNVAKNSHKIIKNTAAVAIALLDEKQEDIEKYHDFVCLHEA